MDLQLYDQHFIVCGASSGFGRAIAEQLMDEGAKVLAVARREEKLQELTEDYPDQVRIVTGDLTDDETLDRIEAMIPETLHGAVFNAGGPPAQGALETSINDWDEAYRLVLRWKVDLALRLVPHMQQKGYGRLLFVESQSAKQPIPNLVLSNAYRAGVIGFVKTLSGEVARDGVTANVIAPGSHSTPAIERVIKKVAESQSISYDEARRQKEAEIPVGRMGKPEEIASLAAWLLSHHASFVTGQTISHDGGNIAGLFG